MAESKTSSPETATRLLSYEKTDFNERISSFKKRVEEQIEVIRIAIKQGTVNDPKIAEKYAKKTERFLGLQFFSDIQYLNKRVQDLKNDLKVLVFKHKVISAILTERISSKRSHKIIMANKYTFANGKYADFYFPYEYQSFYESDLDYLYGIRPKYESQLILVNKIKGILANKDFLKSLGCKSSWKVSTLKEALYNWVQDHSLEAEAELEEAFTLDFFKYKKFLTRDVADFREVVNVYSSALESILEWIDAEINKDLEATKDIGTSTQKLAKKNIYDMYKVYDDFISKYTTMKKTIDEQYSLYRFGQGAIEADIFDSVFK